MIHGCAVNPQTPVVAELAQKDRCPAIAAADARVLSRAPLAPPAGDVTKAQAERWIDGLWGQMRQMNRAGARLLASYAKCRVSMGTEMRRPAHPPANDAAGIGVDHEGHIDKAGPSADVGKVR